LPHPKRVEEPEQRDQDQDAARAVACDQESAGRAAGSARRLRAARKRMNVEARIPGSRTERRVQADGGDPGIASWNL
jgi:hypothetical protein